MHTTIDAETWAIFRDDLSEAVALVESALLTLEQDANAGAEFNVLFRALHTIKGSAGLVGLGQLATLVHAAEDVLSTVRGRGADFGAEPLSALLAVVDLVRTVERECVDGLRPETEKLIDELCFYLDTLSGVGEGRVSFASIGDASLELGEAIVRFCKEGTDELRAAVNVKLRDVREKAIKLCVESYLPLLDEMVRLADEDKRHLLVLHWQFSQLELRRQTRDAVIFDEKPDEYGPAVGLYLEWLLEQIGIFRAASTDSPDLPTVHRLRNDLKISLDVLGDGPRAHLEPAIDVLLQVEPSDTSRVHIALDAVTRSAQSLREEWLSGALSVEVPVEGARPPQTEKPVFTPPESKPGPGPALSLVADEARSEPPVPAPTLLAEATPPRPQAPRAPEKAPESKFLRVEAARVEQLMALAGELGLAAGAVFRHPDFITADVEGLRSGIERVEGLIRELQDTSSSLALVPVGNLFPRLKRLAHDLKQQTGKNFDLETLGGETEIDKTLVDALVEPLIHLIRNAVDHGIEGAEQRAEQGKTATAKITLAARHNGDDITIEVRDDGGGMKRDKILERAVLRGMLDPERAPDLDDSDVWNLIFAPGFSTAETVSSISGRGVGMDVVKDSIQSLRGRVEVKSEVGVGTTIMLHVPLTLAFLDGMVVRVDESLYVIPVNSIVKVFRVESEDVVPVDTDGVDLVRVGRELVPAPTLASLYAGQPPQEPLLRRLVVVVSASRGKLALPIDELLGQEQVTLKPLTGALSDIRGAAACGLLRSGEVALALSCDGLHDLMAS